MSDPTFPALHGRPRLGWVNDPNGLSRFGDRYHLFFQHNPDAPTHGSITWGHVSSADLLGWRDEPVALRPRPGEVDAAGCWSGCVVDDAGVPTALYTAVREQPGDAWATLAHGDADLRVWTPGPAVTARPDDPTIAEVRDPYAFGFAGHRYVVQGAGRPAPDARPALLVYRADDLERWEPLGRLLDDEDPVAATVAAANIWECPNLFPLDGRWVLLVSLWRARSEGVGELSGVRYLVGDLVTDAEPHPGRTGGDGAPRFVPQTGGTLDTGPAFYAPQALVDHERVLLWGWSWELDRTEEQVRASGWAGTLTFARELALVDDTLVAAPAAELTGLRREPLDAGHPVTAPAFELVSDAPFGLVLRTPGGDGTPADGAALDQPVLDPSVFAGGPARVLVDGSLVEAFGTLESHTTRAYPAAGSAWLVTDAAPGAVVGWVLGLPAPLRAGR